MKKILFPTDFSKTANHGFVYALEMAKFLEAELIVLHVYSLPVVSYEGYPSYILEVYDLIDLNNFESFKDEVPHLRKIAEEHGLDFVKMTHVLEEGDLIPIMKKLVEKEKIDMIVMGTTGATGLKETFIGSNTSDVISKIPIVTLCVPANAKFKKIQKIGFTTLFRTKDHHALTKVLELANKLKAKIKCLFVRTFDSDVKETTVAKWREEFKKEDVEFFEIPNEDIKAAVFGFMGQHDIDVLAMLKYKRDFFDTLFQQSLVKSMAFHSKTPILVIPED